MKDVLNISRIQRFSVDDGPGIRSTVFLKGCNLRCRWCHNPENLEKHKVLQFKESSCLFCHMCERVCPSGAHKFTVEEHHVDRDLCVECGRCADVCPNHSLEMIGREERIDDIVNEVLKDRDYYKISGGGVTFSGGEPLLQSRSLAEALKICKEEGIHTAVDTAGNLPFSAFEDVMPYTDLFLYDVKCISEDRHKLFTGAPNSLILQNAKRLRDSHARMWIRTPLIPGFNMDKEELEKIRFFVSDVLGVEHHDELPYHNYGEGKYNMLGMSPTIY